MMLVCGSTNYKEKNTHTFGASLLSFWFNDPVRMGKKFGPQEQPTNRNYSPRRDCFKARKVIQLFSSVQVNLFSLTALYHALLGLSTQHNFIIEICQASRQLSLREISSLPRLPSYLVSI